MSLKGHVWIVYVLVTSSEHSHGSKREKAEGNESARRLKHRSPPGWRTLFRIKFHRRIQLTLFIFSNRQRRLDICVHTCDASLFLSSCSSCCSTHLHISACYPSLWAFYFACGFTIFLLLPFLTWTLLFLLFPSSSRNGFRFGLGRALLVFETEHYFFSVVSWKRYREDVLRENSIVGE